MSDRNISTKGTTACQLDDDDDDDGDDNGDDGDDDDEDESRCYKQRLFSCRVLTDRFL